MQYSIINYNHHTVHYIPMIYLFYNWKFVPFDYLHLFFPPHHNSLASGNLQSVLSMSLVGFFAVFFVFRLYMEDDTVFVFPCLTYFFFYL